MTKVWEKLESKSSYHFPNSWWFRGQIVLNTWHLRKLWRAHEDQIKPRTSELFESETLEQFIAYNSEHNFSNTKTVDIISQTWKLRQYIWCRWWALPLQVLQIPCLHLFLCSLHVTCWQHAITPSPALDCLVLCTTTSSWRKCISGYWASRLKPFCCIFYI